MSQADDTKESTQLRQSGACKVRLTSAEKKAIDDLKKLARKWPKTLWLWSASSSLYVMKYDLAEMPDGMMKGKKLVDDKGIVERIVGIPNDGGDW